MKWNEETPKYRVGDMVECHINGSCWDKHTGLIVAIDKWPGVGLKYVVRCADGTPYRVWENDISYRLGPKIGIEDLQIHLPARNAGMSYSWWNKELLKRMENDYHYGLNPGLKEEKETGIRIGDVVSFRYVGEFLEGYVTAIRFVAGESIYVDIDCGGGSIITCYPVDNIINNLSANRRSAKAAINEAFGYYLPAVCKCDKEEKEVYTPNIKINQTEITGGDRKGLYSTVFFNYANTDPVTIKKSEDANNDILLAIAYANALRYCDTNSKFKKRIDKETIKIGNDYAIQLDWRNIFIPNEILKRKRWDIYTYVAVQLLFRTFSIKDIQEAIENCTYTKKEK